MLKIIADKAVHTPLHSVIGHNILLKIASFLDPQDQACLITASETVYKDVKSTRHNISLKLHEERQLLECDTSRAKELQTQFNKYEQEQGGYTLILEMPETLIFNFVVNTGLDDVDKLIDLAISLPAGQRREAIFDGLCGTMYQQTEIKCFDDIIEKIDNAEYADMRHAMVITAFETGIMNTDKDTINAVLDCFKVDETKHLAYAHKKLEEIFLDVQKNETYFKLYSLIDQLSCKRYRERYWQDKDIEGSNTLVAYANSVRIQSSLTSKLSELNRDNPDLYITRLVDRYTEEANQAAQNCGLDEIESVGSADWGW